MLTSILHQFRAAAAASRRRRRAELGAKGRRLRRAGLSFVTMETRLLPTVSIVINYTYDTNNFFDTQAKRDLLQLAANTLGNSLNDSLNAITPGGTNTWTANFPNPSNITVSQTVGNMTVPANTIILFVGGSTLNGTSEAGEGSTGGFNGTGNTSWITNLQGRGQSGALLSPATDYGPWGGSIAFDNSGITNWYFGQTAAGITSGQTDFLSVAEHEIGHVLGIGTSPSWIAQVSGNVFTGSNAEAAHGGQPVPVSSGKDHWASGTTSNGALAAMDPTLANGSRVLFTTLDYAGLADVGWQVQRSAPTAQLASSAVSVNDNAGTASIVVNRTGDLAPFTVNYATSDGTAVAGTNYTSTTGTLSFAAGDLSKTITVPISADLAIGANLTFNVALSNPSTGAVLGGTSTTLVTIIDTKNKPIADFDADEETDMGVFRPLTTQFFVRRTTAGTIVPFPMLGAANLVDIPVVGDFDQVGHPELAVFRPLTAQWFVLGDNGAGHLLGTFGASGLTDIPVPGDYLGLGYTQMAVFRPSTGQWFVNTPTGGKLMGVFGASNMVDIPAPGDYLGLGYTQMAVFRPSTAQWFVNSPTGGKFMGIFGAAGLVDVPAPGDYDGLGHTQMAVFRPSTAQWFGNGVNGGHLIGSLGATNYVDLPIEGSVGSLIKLGVLSSPGIRASSVGNTSGFSAMSLSGPTETTPIVFDQATITPTLPKRWRGFGAS